MLILYVSCNIDVNPLGAMIEIRNFTACAMLVINCVQAHANDCNEPSAFLVPTFVSQRMKEEGLSLF